MAGLCLRQTDLNSGCEKMFGVQEGGPRAWETVKFLFQVCQNVAYIFSEQNLEKNEGM